MTPLLLLMILGFIGIGMLILDVMRLTHAAQEGSVAGALNPGDSCGVALITARQVYGSALPIAECMIQGGYIEVTIGRMLELNRISPIWSAPIQETVTARAALR